ncbi:BON domain-containing protein [Psychrobacter sp. 1U1]|uniref:BON domain-containing protein n=2 Tax=unclassified Psychrobacter TaxID=196806 RepID=UPI003F46900C
MTRLYTLKSVYKTPRVDINRAMIGAVLMASMVSTGCTTNYLTNSTEGTYGVPVTERTIPQRLLDRSIEHTAKINVYGLQEDLQTNSRISIDSFYSEVLLTGEVPTEALKTQIEKVVGSMPDVRRVYNELNVSVARGYSSTVHDGYITSKLMAKTAANNGVKASQLKAVTNDGVVYIMGRVTPTQQSHLIDIANSTAGITELVLLTTVVDNRGLPINDADIMSESEPKNAATQATGAGPIVREIEPATAAGNVAPTTPVANNSASEAGDLTEQPSSSPYVDLYQNP